MRPRATGLGLLCLGLTAPAVRAGPPETDARPTYELRLFADTDDDDGDGRPDRDAEPGGAADVVWFEGEAGKPLSVRSLQGRGLRVLIGARVYGGGAVSASRVGLQGVGVGEATVELGDRTVHARVCEVFARAHDGQRVDLASGHASLSRTLPPMLEREVGGGADEDALSWVLVCPRGAAPSSATLSSSRASGRPLDSVELAMTPTACPEGVGKDVECATTEPIRLTVDSVDRSHPTTTNASVLGEVGGALALAVEGREAGRIRVGGPRQTPIGPLERFRGRLVFHVVRTWPGGDPSIGGNDAGAKALVLREIRTLDAIWGQCGIVFSPVEPEAVRVVDPPPPSLLAVGCDLGMPATGGHVRLRVDDQDVEIPTHGGETPDQVAERAAQRIRALGFDVIESANARTASAAYRTIDLRVLRRGGHPARLQAADGPLSDDPSLGVCIGEVDLSDGLDHFGDLNAVAGTVEERALVKALQDDDPRTIDVFVIGSFSKTGRIGESFIDADRSSIQNAVIIDRAGIRAGVRSYALAHELGHVLLDMPGHPDDFGVDRPWMLMDADAADPTIFGPRRLPVDACVRAIRQSGPDAPLPLLEGWPLVSKPTGPASPRDARTRAVAPSRSPERGSR
jgi:hypothetical protein